MLIPMFFADIVYVNSWGTYNVKCDDEMVLTVDLVKSSSSDYLNIVLQPPYKGKCKVKLRSDDPNNPHKLDGNLVLGKIINLNIGNNVVNSFNFTIEDVNLVNVYPNGDYGMITYDGSSVNKMIIYIHGTNKYADLTHYYDFDGGYNPSIFCADAYPNIDNHIIILRKLAIQDVLSGSKTCSNLETLLVNHPGGHPTNFNMLVEDVVFGHETCHTVGGIIVELPDGIPTYFTMRNISFDGTTDLTISGNDGGLNEVPYIIVLRDIRLTGGGHLYINYLIRSVYKVTIINNNIYSSYKKGYFSGVQSYGEISQIGFPDFIYSSIGNGGEIDFYIQNVYTHFSNPSEGLSIQINIEGGSYDGKFKAYIKNINHISQIQADGGIFPDDNYHKNITIDCGDPDNNEIYLTHIKMVGYQDSNLIIRNCRVDSAYLWADGKIEIENSVIYDPTLITCDADGTNPKLPCSNISIDQSTIHLSPAEYNIRYEAKNLNITNSHIYVEKDTEKYIYSTIGHTESIHLIGNKIVIEDGKEIDYFLHTGPRNKNEGDSVFEFFDDFYDDSLDTDKWEENYAGSITYTIQDGYIEFTDADDNWLNTGEVGNQIKAKITLPSNYVIEWREYYNQETSASPMSKIGIGLHKSDKSTEVTGLFVDVHTANIEYKAYGWVGSSSSPTATLDHSTYYNYQIKKDGTNYNIKLTDDSGNDLIDFTASSSETIDYFSMVVGKYSGKPLKKGRIDWVFVRKYDPDLSYTITYGSEETGEWKIDGDTYTKRKKITINSNKDESDYQIALDYNQLNTQDMAIAPDNSKYSVPYWIEHDIDGNPLDTVWIKVDLSTGNNIFYAYYDRSQAHVVVYNNWFETEGSATPPKKEWIYATAVDYEHNKERIFGMIPINKGTWIAGNYWEDNTGCTDSDGDCICDSPYTPDSSGTDNLPLKLCTPTTVSDCMDITTTGYYEVSGSLPVAPLYNPYCLKIDADWVYLDLYGGGVSGGTSGTAIEVLGDNDHIFDTVGGNFPGKIYSSHIGIDTHSDSTYIDVPLFDYVDIEIKYSNIQDDVIENEDDMTVSGNINDLSITDSDDITAHEVTSQDTEINNSDDVLINSSTISNVHVTTSITTINNSQVNNLDVSPNAEVEMNDTSFSQIEVGGVVSGVSISTDTVPSSLGFYKSVVGTGLSVDETEDELNTLTPDRSVSVDYTPANNPNAIKVYKIVGNVYSSVEIKKIDKQHKKVEFPIKEDGVFAVYQPRPININLKTSIFAVGISSVAGYLAYRNIKRRFH